jgi:hypothetical protein
VILITQALNAVSKPMVTQAAPGGMLSFELAGSVPAAEAILRSWSAEARMSAGLSLGLDFIYIIAYTTAFSLICTLAASRLLRYSRTWARMGGGFAWGILAAGVFDVIENIALIRVLFGDVSTFWIKTAWLSASIKFSLIVFAMTYVLFAFILIFFQVLKGKRVEFD